MSPNYFSTGYGQGKGHPSPAPHPENQTMAIYTEELTHLRQNFLRDVWMKTTVSKQVSDLACSLYFLFVSLPTTDEHFTFQSRLRRLSRISRFNQVLGYSSLCPVEKSMGMIVERAMSSVAGGKY
jgi:hypothetical protein